MFHGEKEWCQQGFGCRRYSSRINEFANNSLEALALDGGLFGDPAKLNNHRARFLGGQPPGAGATIGKESKEFFLDGQHGVAAFTLLD